MTSLELIARASRQFERGIITADEFATKLSDAFAGDLDLSTQDAGEVAALIRPEVRALVLRRVEAALAPTYMRQAFALGGKRRTEDEERAAALRETERERAWAKVLRPLLAGSAQ